MTNIHPLQHTKTSKATPAVKTAKIQRGKPFMPGTSGNPSGRPKGSRNRTTVAVQALIDGEGEGIARKAVDLALSGDATALRLMMERLTPPRRDSLIQCSLPKINNAEDCCKALSAVIRAVAEGEITPSEGMDITALLDRFRHAYEASILEARVHNLEKRV